MFRTSYMRRCGAPAPPVPPASSATASERQAPAGAPSAASAKLDPKAAERVKVAEAMGEEAVAENARILKQLGMRGLRAFVIGGLGLVLFSIVLKRKRREADAEAELAAAAQKSGADDAPEDPTARYLREMEGQGWDVKEGEDRVKAARSTTSRKTAT